MPDEDICFMKLHEQADGIRRRKLSPVEVVNAHLRRIEEVNPKVFGFFEVAADSACEEAKRAESEIVKGNYRGPMHGIPFGVKDIIDTVGLRTTKGFRSFPGQCSLGRRRMRCPAETRGGNSHRQVSYSRIRVGALQLQPALRNRT